MDEFMCDVETVKDWLNGYRELVRDINNQRARLDRMEMKLYSLGSPSFSDMPKSVSSTPDRNATKIDEKCDLENSIDEEELYKERKRQMIELVLKQLKSADERAVIRVRYIDVSSWDDVTDVLFGDREDYIGKEDTYLRRSHKLHGSALKHIAGYLMENPIPEILADM